MEKRKASTFDAIKKVIEQGELGLGLARLTEAIEAEGWQDLGLELSHLQGRYHSSERERGQGLRRLDEHEQVSAQVRLSVLRLLADCRGRAEAGGAPQEVPEDDLAVNLFLMAQLAQSKRKYEEAIALFTQAIEAAPAFPEAYIERGITRCALRKPDYAAALKDYERALELQPGHPLALVNRGVLYLNGLGDLPSACRSWKAVQAQGSPLADDYLKKYCQDL